MQISVIVNETIKEGQLGAFLEYMREMIALTKEEDGCIAYDLYEATDGSGEIVMVELWESQESLDAHIQSEHFKRLIPGTDVFKAEPTKVKVYSIL